MIPPSYMPATVRGVLPQQVNGDMAFSFDTADGTVRLRISGDGAIWLASVLFESMDYLTRTKVQSAMSSGSPHSDGSPQSGQSV